MDIKKAFALIVCWIIFCFAKVNPAVKEKESINWLTLKEVNLKFKTESKPVLIDLFTDWCYWCKVMDKKTYNNPKVIAYINTHFYAVKVDAETKNQLLWNEKNYNYNPDNKINEFALYVTQGQLGFPTTVIFPDIKKEPAAIPGYMNAREIEEVLKYFGEGNYKSESFESFSAKFKSTW